MIYTIIDHLLRSINQKKISKLFAILIRIMPQELNFNTSPYFDDFDVDKTFIEFYSASGYPVHLEN